MNIERLVMLVTRTSDNDKVSKEFLDAVRVMSPREKVMLITILKVKGIVESIEKLKTSGATNYKIMEECNTIFSKSEEYTKLLISYLGNCNGCRSKRLALKEYNALKEAIKWDNSVIQSIVVAVLALSHKDSDEIVLDVATMISAYYESTYYADLSGLDMRVAIYVMNYYDICKCRRGL